jgi:hypothetical protein
MWRKAKDTFDRLEQRAATKIERVIQSPLLFGPAGRLLAAAAQAKIAMDNGAEAMIGAAGLPTKRDQERTLRMLCELQSEILDLKEQLEDARAPQLQPSEGPRARQGVATEPHRAQSHQVIAKPSGRKPNKGQKR